MNFLETFLDLTEYTIPFGSEETFIPKLKKYIPSLTKDIIGNYYITIGNSETLFTTHIDTYCEEMIKVNHIITEKNGSTFISTDKKTILGGDNKNGMTILIYMIKNNIPGTYYFFIGEEPLKSGGLYGSKKILNKNPDFFKKFKRAIAFDRKEYGSVVCRQMARPCCSKEFSDALVEQLNNNRIPSFKDIKAYYTDTATFLNIIPEITNISAGGFKEHTVEESTDITYIENLAKAAIKINWEILPTVRKPEKISTLKDNIIKFNKFKNKKLIDDSKLTFKKVDFLLDLFGYLCLNPSEFYPGIDMVYSHWHEENEFNIKIIGKEIHLNNKNIGNIKDFKDLLNLKFEDIVNQEELLQDIYDFLDSKNDLKDENEDFITFEDMNVILDQHNSDIDEFLDFLGKGDSELNELLSVNYDKKIINIL